MASFARRRWQHVRQNVFDHLIELTPDGTLVPGLAVAWHWANDRTLGMALRQGLRFHNGEIFDAEIVKLNWEEYVRQKQLHLFQLYAVNKAAHMVPYATTHLMFAEMSVTEQHWSVRKQKATVQE